MSLKNLIWNLSDFEFLASIESVDFRSHRIIIAPEFFNYLVGRTREHFNAHSKYEITSIITFLRRIYFTRLGLVNPHSMRRWFDREINVKYLLTKFFWKVNRHFTNLEKDNNFTQMLNERKSEQKRQKKNLKKKQRRQRRRLAKQQETISNSPIQQPIDDQSNVDNLESESNHSSKDDEIESVRDEQQENQSDDEQSDRSDVVDNLNEILFPVQQNNETAHRRASEFRVDDEDSFNEYWDLVEQTTGHQFDSDNDWDFIVSLLRGGISPTDRVGLMDEMRIRDNREQYLLQSEDEEN